MIDEALIDINGLSIRDLADKWQITKSTLNYHKQKHIHGIVSRNKRTQERLRDYYAEEAAKKEIIKNLEATEKEQNAQEVIFAKVRKLESEADRLKAVAEESGDIRTALLAVRELARLVELIAKLYGELNEAPQTNIQINMMEQWINVRTQLISILDEYPEVRQRIIDAFAPYERPIQ
jgi:hypothetical protein